MNNARAHQSGVALISVLLIVALVSALLYHMISRHALTIARSHQGQASSQSMAYALGAEAFGRQILAENWADQEGRLVDHLEEAWAQPLAPFDVDEDEGFLEFQIIDLQGQFNLNALADGDAAEHLNRMRRLLTTLGLDVRIADLWKDWVDADDIVTGFGAEDAQYLLLEPPYRNPNHPAAHISELRALHEIEQEQVDELLPHVTVLPHTALRINVNTANARTLQALAPQLGDGDAAAIVNGVRRFETVEEAVAAIPALNGAEGLLSVTSEFFRIDAMAEINGVRTQLSSTVHRNPDDGSIRVLARDFGRRYVSIHERSDD